MLTLKSARITAHCPLPTPPAHYASGRRLFSPLRSFGGNGRYAGQLHWINAIATDSDNNIYTGEVEQGKRIQKFVPVWQ